MQTRKRKNQLTWRDVLTDEERAILNHADRLRADWIEANRDRPRIVNRAINRAKYMNEKGANNG